MKTLSKNSSNEFNLEIILENMERELQEKKNNDRRVRKTYEAIERSCEQLFEEKKYADITMEEIAKNADITRATLYTHFKNKDEIFFQIGYERFKIMNENLEKIIQSQNTGKELILKLCSMMLERVDENPLATRIVTIFLKHPNVELVDKLFDGKIEPDEAQKYLESKEITIMVQYLSQIRKYEKIWSEIIQKGITDGSITTNLEPIQLVHYLIIIMNGTIDQMVLKSYILDKYNLKKEIIFTKTMHIIKQVLEEKI